MFVYKLSSGNSSLISADLYIESCGKVSFRCPFGGRQTNGGESLTRICIQIMPLPSQLFKGYFSKTFFFLERI